jgi:hypothetical protein
MSVSMSIEGVKDVFFFTLRIQTSAVHFTWHLYTHHFTQFKSELLTPLDLNRHKREMTVAPKKTHAVISKSLICIHVLILLYITHDTFDAYI